MFIKTAVTGVAASALLASVAFAQTPSATTDTTTSAPAATSTTTTTTKTTEVSTKGNWRTSKLVGLNVYNESNESIGSINDMLTDKSGDIKAVVIGVGGFLGIGEHLVAVPLDKVKFVDEPVVSAAAAPAAGGAGGARPASTTTTGAATTTPAAPAVKKNPWYPDHAVFNATKDQLKSMPEFKYTTE
ncbi:MAG: PRC-barrel domain-containing protein [Bradyrhizobium sp.]